MKIISLCSLFITSAFANYPIQVSVLLDVGAASVTVQNAGTGGSDVSLQFSPGASERVRFAITPGLYIPPPAGTTYSTCASPCAVSVNRNWGQQYYWVEYVNSSGNSFSPRKISQAAGAFAANVCNGLGTLPQVKFSAVTTSPMPMPLVVVGQDCYVADYQFPLVNLSGFTLTGLRLYLRVHNPGYNTPGRPDGKVSVSINGGAWLTLTNAAATAIDESRYYGGIGSFDQVREFTLPIPNGTIGSGDTAVSMSFRFNGTEGIVSGYRILSLNILQANKSVSNIAVTSNIATSASISHSFSSGNTVLIQNAPGMYMRFNGLRTLTGVATNSFTFTPCGTGDAACTSPNGSYIPPVSTDNTGNAATAQAVMYAARCLIAKSSFAQTDPTTWTAPAGGDATRGGNLFTKGNAAGTGGLTDQLKNPNLPYYNDTLHYGTCGGATGCHTSTGSDLKRFAYDNWSITQRTIFHGFTEQDGIDIAAYIRGLSVAVPAKGRPWNPPFQPGPGMSKSAWTRAGSTLTNIVVASNVATATMSSDPGCVVGDPIVISGATVDIDLNGEKIITSCGSNTAVFSTTNVANGTYTESTLIASQAAKFFAGCGRDCVLTYAYEDLREYLFADTSKFLWNSRLEVRDIPIPYPFADWNKGWLPVFFPGDSYQPFNFLGSSLYLDWIDTVDNMTPNNFSSFQSHNYGYNQRVQAYKAWVDALPGQLSSSGANENLAGNHYPSAYPLIRQSLPSYSLMKFYEIALDKQTFQFGGLTVQAQNGGSADGSPLFPLPNGNTGGTLFNSPSHKFTLNGILDASAPNSATGTHLATEQTQSNAWYVAEVIKGGGNGFGSPDAPIDDAYLQAFLRASQNLRPGGYMATLYHAIVSLQNGNLLTNFAYYPNPVSTGADYGSVWSATYTYETKASLPWFTTARWTEQADQVLNAINATTAAHNTAYWNQIFTNRGCTPSTPVSAFLAWTGSLGDVQVSTAMLLPFFKVWGVNATNLTTYLNWIKSLDCASNHDWDADFAAASNGTGTTNGAQAATGDLAAGSVTVTFNTSGGHTGCPSSAAQAQSGDSLMYTFWGGTGQFESARPTGGTCTQGGAGTLTFTTLYAHTGSWKISWGCDVGIPPNWNFGSSATQLPFWRCSNMF